MIEKNKKYDKVVVHCLGGVGIDLKIPKYKCPIHGEIEHTMSIILNDKVYNFKHDYCLVCYDEFLRGKRKDVNLVKKI